MGYIKLPYVERTTAKGRVYWYFRRGKIRLRLPDPSDPAFAAEYQKHLAGAARQAPGHGTMAWLVQSYRQSPAFKEQRPSSRQNRETYFDIIIERWGKDRASRLTRGNVIEIRDVYGETPGKANNLLATLSVLMERAIDIDLREINPCANVTRLKTGEYKRWPENVLQDAMEAASPMLRLTIASLYYGGQRVSDTVRMSRALILRGDAQLIQQKTGKLVTVPLHSVWGEEIARVQASDRATTLLFNRYGRPLTEDAVQERWRRLRAVIGAEGYHLHGLRKNACSTLAEAGCTAPEIAAITGQSLSMVEHYIKEADQPVLAMRAIRRREEHDRNKSAKLSGKTAKPGNGG